MKKKYEKPMVLFEDFTMSTNIASQCEVTTNLQGYQECGIKAYDLDLSNSGIYDGNVLYSYCGIARKATRKERLFQAKSRFDYSSRFIGLDTYNGYLSDP